MRLYMPYVFHKLLVGRGLYLGGGVEVFSPLLNSVILPKVCEDFISNKATIKFTKCFSQKSLKL